MQNGKICLQVYTSYMMSPNFVLVPIKDWERLNLKIAKFEQEMKMKKMLTDALNDAKSNRKKNSIEQFLNEL